eukprot:TRINITY_DN31050_c0_g1_i1.p1 TRINITY_DN31050_c0_g1~~TRINITY_DN31050_c0_g1_i1.p1  ORF type:complete len:805 (-),score=163.60 TRINITY_DN31050_c0_g1_i1:204-2618(-)
MSGTELRFFLSRDINSPVAYRVEKLKGKLPNSTFDAEEEMEGQPLEFYVECALYIDGAQFGLPTRTRLFLDSNSENSDELYTTLSAKYRDLTNDAQLAFTVWDVSSHNQETVVGGATLRLFNGKNQLKTGQQKLRLWCGKKADGSLETSTPGKVPKAERGEAERLGKLVNKYQLGQLPHIGWLDELAFKAIDKIKENESKSVGTSNLHLLINLRPFEHPVVFQDLGVSYPSSSPFSPTNDLVTIWDPEVGRPNPSENKQVKLARSLTREVIDRDLKPSSNERKEIYKILKYPPTRALNGEERQLLWKFRFSLKSDKRALTKFLRCVEWSDAQEARQALDLMRRWAPIDAADALELLSPVFQSEEVRAYAVNVLERADDEELQCYLLQLVQALRFERSENSHLVHFLVQRSANNIDLASFLRWYVLVEIYAPTYARKFYMTFDMMEEHIKNKPGGIKMLQNLVRQHQLIAQLCTIAKEVKSTRGGTQKKIEKLRELFEGLLSELTSFEPIPLPLDPKVLITGIIPSESTIFKSALSPLRLTFKTVTGEKCKVMYKKGDDMRQDQLVIQMISLMDRLLKLENLDLYLTPYRVLATGQDEGMIEFIPSSSLASILSEHRSIVNYLQQYHADENGPFGITSTCLETFIKSCAGYSVITYILGVGDRHLDNLLLREDGRLFHVDFGYILGRDPKPFPPPMKLCKEMVETMGGTESLHYERFKTYCCEAYNILRKSSNLLLNLFYLMAGASIPDIASDPEKGILKLQEKFRLDLDDEEAIQFFQTLINESVSALFPQMVETIHRWAQYWR